MKNTEFGRVLNKARIDHGFKSQRQLDAFYAHNDHQHACAECQKPGRMVELSDGMQPTLNSCSVADALYAEYLET